LIIIAENGLALEDHQSKALSLFNQTKDAFTEDSPTFIYRPTLSTIGSTGVSRRKRNYQKKHLRDIYRKVKQTHRNENIREYTPRQFGFKTKSRPHTTGKGNVNHWKV